MPPIGTDLLDIQRWKWDPTSCLSQGKSEKGCIRHWLFYLFFWWCCAVIFKHLSCLIQVRTLQFCSRSWQQTMAWETFNFRGQDGEDLHQSLPQPAQDVPRHGHHHCRTICTPHWVCGQSWISWQRFWWVYRDSWNCQVSRPRCPNVAHSHSQNECEGPPAPPWRIMSPAATISHRHEWFSLTHTLPTQQWIVLSHQIPESSLSSFLHERGCDKSGIAPLIGRCVMCLCGLWVWESEYAAAECKDSVTIF